MSELPPSNEIQPVRRSGAWVGAIILIGVGIILLMQNFGFMVLHNWWALFILLGTAGAWGSAWRIYQNNGHRITPPVTGAFIGGLFPLGVAMIFLFDLNWGTLWPVFLILAGVAVLAKSFSSSL